MSCVERAEVARCFHLYMSGMLGAERLKKAVVGILV